MGHRKFILKSEGLRLRRNQRLVLDGLDLRLRGGAMAVLLVQGRETPTTLAEGLCGASRLRVESGTLSVGGQDVAGLDSLQRARLGMILVDPGRVVAGVTVTNHVRIAGRDPDAELGPQELRKRLLQALDCLGLDSHFAGRTLPEDPPFPDRLRLVLLTIAVVRAQVAVVPIEPENVDLDMVRLLVQGLQEIDRSASAVVLLTRDARLAQALQADQKWLLQEGRIVGKVPERRQDLSPEV